MTQHTQTQPYVVPPLLDIATVSDGLTEIYNSFKDQGDTASTTAFAAMAKNEYLGWRGDQVKANDFLNAARALLAPPAPVEDEAQVEAEAESAVAVAPAPEPVTAGPVIVPQPDTDPNSLFGQLRALFDRGPGSGYRIMGSFLPNGQQRLIIIDEHLSAQKLDTIPLTATDAEFDTDLAPLLSEHLAAPAHTVRTLAAQVAQAAKTQAASNKKPVTPAKTTTPAPTAAKPAAKPAPISSTTKITLTPPVPASGTYDGPTNDKVKFANGAATLMGLKPGEYTLKVTADGHLDAEQKFTVTGAGTMTVPVTLVSAGLDF